MEAPRGAIAGDRAGVDVRRAWSERRGRRSRRAPGDGARSPQDVGGGFRADARAPAQQRRRARGAGMREMYGEYRELKAAMDKENARAAGARQAHLAGRHPALASKPAPRASTARPPRGRLGTPRERAPAPSASDPGPPPPSPRPTRKQRRRRRRRRGRHPGQASHPRPTRSRGRIPRENRTPRDRPRRPRPDGLPAPKPKPRATPTVTDTVSTATTTESPKLSRPKLPRGSSRAGARGRVGASRAAPIRVATRARRARAGRAPREVSPASPPNARKETVAMGSPSNLCCATRAARSAMRFAPTGLRVATRGRRR